MICSNPDCPHHGTEHPHYVVVDNWDEYCPKAWGPFCTFIEASTFRKTLKSDPLVICELNAHGVPTHASSQSD